MMLGTVHSFLAWRLSKRSTIPGWITVFGGQFLAGGLAMAGLLAALGAPINPVSSYSIAMFAIGAGLAGVGLAFAWAAVALGLSSIALGSLWGVWPASPSWWSQAAAQWNSGVSVPGSVVAVLLALPVFFCLASFGLNKLLEKTVIRQLGKLMERRALIVLGDQSNIPEGQVTDDEVAQIMRQNRHDVDGLCVTDRPSIVANESAQGAATSAGDTSGSSNSIYDGLAAGANNARLAGLGEAASDSRQRVGPDGSVRNAAETPSVKGLLPARFGGTKSKRDLPKEDCSRLRVMAQTYMLEVDNNPDPVSAIEGFIAHFDKQLLGLTDEHFSYLKTLSEGNGAGVIETARAHQESSLTTKTEFDRSVDQTAGIDTLDVSKIRRTGDIEIEEPADVEDAPKSENAKALEEAAQKGGGGRIASLLQAYEQKMKEESAQLQAGGGAEEPAPAGAPDTKQEAGNMTNEAGTAPEDTVPTTAEEILAMTKRPDDGPRAGGARQCSADGKGNPPVTHPGGFPPRDEDEDEAETESQARDDQKELLGFADATQTRPDESKEASKNEEPMNANTPGQSESATVIVPEHCQRISALIDGVGEDVEIRHKIEQFVAQLGVSLADLLDSAAMRQTFNEGRCLQIKNHVQALMRATAGSSMSEVSRSLASAQQRISEFEDTPYRMTQNALNQLETQVSLANEQLGKMAPNNVKVIDALVQTANLCHRIEALREVLAENAEKPAEKEVSADDFGHSTSVLDRVIRANRQVSTTAESKPASAPGPSRPGATPDAVSEQARQSATESPNASPLAAIEGACERFPDLMEIAAIARSGGEWHKHEALGDVFADPFLEPVPEGSDTIAYRDKQSVLLKLRVAAQPQAKLDRKRDEAEAQRRSEIARLRQEGEQVAKDREALRRESEAIARERQALEAREKAVAVNAQRVEATQKRMQDLAAYLEDFEVLKREVNVTFSSMKVPDRFSRFASDFAKLQITRDLFARTMSVALVGVQMIAGEDVPEHHRPQYVARNAMDAGFLARSNDILVALCEEMNVPFDKDAEEALLSKLSDSSEIEFVKQVFEYHKRGKSGAEISRQWVQQHRIDAEFAQKGRSADIEDVVNLRSQTFELSEKSKSLERDLSAARKALSEAEQEIATNREMVAADLELQRQIDEIGLTEADYDERVKTLRAEILLLDMNINRAGDNCFFDACGKRVYMGLVQAGQGHEPSYKRTIAEIISEKKPAVLFTNSTKLPSCVDDYVTVLPMTSAAIEDFYRTNIAKEKAVA